MKESSPIQNEIPSSITSYLENKGLQGEVVEISVFQGERIKRDNTSENKILITEKLNGCTATIIWTNASAQLVHFPPFMLDRHLEKISELATEEDVSGIEKHAFIYLSTKRSENETKIVEHIKKSLGDDVSITVKYYDKESDPQSEFIGVELKPNDEGITVHHGGNHSDF